MKDYDIISALIGQVRKAAGHDSERSVTTYISRPLWREFNRQLKQDPDVEPTEWLGIGKTHRVYGSKTIVVETPAFWAASFKP